VAGVKFLVYAGQLTRAAIGAEAEEVTSGFPPLFLGPVGVYALNRERPRRLRYDCSRVEQAHDAVVHSYEDRAEYVATTRAGPGWLRWEFLWLVPSHHISRLPRNCFHGVQRFGGRVTVAADEERGSCDLAQETRICSCYFDLIFVNRFRTAELARQLASALSSRRT